MLHESAVRDPLAKLEALGSPDQIAQFFENEGVLGDRGCATSCPVANYLRHELGLGPHEASISVGPAGAIVVDTSDLASDVVRSVRTPVPEVIQQFMQKFDSHDYPLLDTQGPHSW